MQLITQLPKLDVMDGNVVHSSVRKHSILDAISHLNLKPNPTQNHTQMNQQEKRHVRPIIHFMAGGIGGTVGAVITCPLEVVKTRLQSSIYRTQTAKGLRSILR